MNEGRIVEQGSHDELLERDGLFRQLHVAQTTRRRRRRLVETAVEQPTDGLTRGSEISSEDQEATDERGEKAAEPSRRLLLAFQRFEQGDAGPLQALATRRSDPDESVRAAAVLAERLLDDARQDEEDGS
jgi:hypothetical protein